MRKSNLKLLDCTLRDGGYINSWKWGYDRARMIIKLLVKAGIDVVETGFLRDVDEYDPDITVCNRIEELNRLLPEEKGEAMFSAMAMQSNYNVEKLSPYNGFGIELIRVTAHDYDLEDGFQFARRVKEKGYKVSINPINIMGYSDEQVLKIVEKVNEIQPYQFSVVDTFGSMKKRDLERLISLVEHNLDENIRLALHLHENMSLGCSLSQTFIDMHLNRPTSIDGSLLGMGRMPGNLPIELVADYLNDNADKNYDIDYLLDAIQEYIEPIKGNSEWGYTPAYFLSARFNLHRNYAEHYLGKGDLTSRDINHILARIGREKATAFDKEYADKLYSEYINHQIDDAEYRSRLKKEIGEQNILVLAPGSSIKTHREQVDVYIKEKNPCIISVNFIPEEYEVSYAFFANNRRFESFADKPCKIIATSNLIEHRVDYYIDYNSVSGAFKNGCNSLIMLLTLLRSLKIKEVVLAGADGYGISSENYYSSQHTSYIQRDNKFNLEVAGAIKKIGLEVKYLTPSRYELKTE